MSRPASRPPEARGLARDGVRLLVATPDGLAHARFGDLPRFLAAGDLLVVNNSATIAAAVDGRRTDGRPVTVHMSTPLDDGLWVAELRHNASTDGPVTDGAAGETILLPGGATLTLRERYPDDAATRLWTTAVTAAGDVPGYLARHGRPIRYAYVPDPWPLEAYQSVFASVPGSAEMPSAARPFTAELVTRLVSAGVLLAPITLHAGVASLETGEPPLPERYAVPEVTARLVNLTRAAGRRVIAVGTTVTRALESATDKDGTVVASRGWTDLVLHGDRRTTVVDGLITGWHDQGASHLDLLHAVAGSALVSSAYAEAERSGYLWHEFGDSCLLLPGTSRAWPAQTAPTAPEREHRSYFSPPLGSRA
jgi:S-adenosylmethionine:tRNA ribosyltransferase-isomerase